MRVFLCADALGRFCWIRTSAADPVNYIEDRGLEAVEDQSKDFEDMTADELFAADVFTVSELIANAPGLRLFR